MKKGHGLGLGVMLDCSRGAVMQTETLHRYIDLLAVMDYRTLMLYTEDTYEIKEEPYFGYLRGRYTQEELREIDAYAASRGIELIPCIQTLAHLDGLVRWGAYRSIIDTDNILLAEEEATYRLIEQMFRTLATCFTSRRVHIGMDEAWRVGLGKYLEKHGFTDRTGILLRHLTRVVEIATRYGFRPMMWSDMFFHLATGGHYRPDATFSDAVMRQVPPDLDLVYWDYYHFDPNFYTGVLRVHQRFSNPVIFAGGLWTWYGFSPLSQRALAVTDAAMAACREVGCRDIFFTLWGDDGGECSYFAALPLLYYAARAVDERPDPDRIREDFRAVTGEDFDALMALGRLHELESGERFINPAKVWLYQDPLLGLYDRTVPAKAPAYYRALADELDTAADASPTLSLLFRSQAALARAVGRKCRLGVRARAAYRAGDRETLRTLAEAELPQAAEAVDAFHRAYERLWFSENKPNGYERHDARLAGVSARLRTAAARLSAYLAGEATALAELEEDILPVDPIALDALPIESFYQRIARPF